MTALITIAITTGPILSEMYDATHVKAIELCTRIIAIAIDLTFDIEYDDVNAMI